VITFSLRFTKHNKFLKINRSQLFHLKLFIWSVPSIKSWYFHYGLTNHWSCIWNISILFEHISGKLSATYFTLMDECITAFLTYTLTPVWISDDYFWYLQIPFVHLGFSQTTTANVRYANYGVSMRPRYLPAIVDVIKFYEWKGIIYLYQTDDGKCHLH